MDAGPALDYDFENALAACARGELTMHLRRAPLPVAVLVELATPPAAGEPYGRRVLHRSAAGEALLVRFREDTYCAPHDHGPARAALCVLRGAVVERRFRFDGTTLTLAREHTLPHDAPFDVPAQTIHCTKGTGDALALHFYVPAIHGMRIYDPVARRTLVVDDDHGAWWPRDARAVMSSRSWP